MMPEQEIIMALCALNRAERIQIYVAGDESYCRIPTFDRYQKVHKPSSFRNPEEIEGGVLPSWLAPVPENPAPLHALNPLIPESLKPSIPRFRAAEVDANASMIATSSEQVRIIDIRGPPSVDNAITSTEETPKENTVIHSAMQPACGDTKPAQKDQLAVAASAVSDQRSQRKHPAPREDAFVLPERVPSKPWAEFLAMRVRIKKPLTEEGKGRAVLKLDALAAAGHDRQLVIEQSVDNQWAGLFPLKADAYIAPSRTEKSKPLCVHCGGNGDLMSYDRKPIHARCLDAWQLGQQGAMDSARRAS
jgi:hypothetical protein